MSGTVTPDAVRAYKDVIGELDRRRRRPARARRRAGRGAAHGLVDLARRQRERRAPRRHWPAWRSRCRWEQVLDALWEEDWMTLAVPPHPDRSPAEGPTPDASRP